MEQESSMTFDDILKASEKILVNVKRTQLIRAEKLDDLVGAIVYLKPENLQLTGSFKIRGATNCILSLSEEQQSKGVVAASSGNHAQAVAYAAGAKGIKATIVMPVDAPKVKVDNTMAYGAEVVKCGYTGIERDEKVEELIRINGFSLVHSHADPKIIAGQGTVGYEIMSDMPDLDAVVLPCGAGGLIAGSSLAIKHMNIKTKVIGVEPENIPRYRKSLEAGKAITVEMGQTLADGLRVNNAKDLNLQIIREYVDELVGVSDEYILKAMKEIIMKAKLLVEPSATVGIAAVMEGNIKFSPKEKVCFVLSGGNVDEEFLLKVLK